MTRFATSVDLAAFAPDVCGRCGRDMSLGSGNRATSSFPCLCAGARLHHIKVACVCGTAYYDPPHEEGQ